jgi:hypothetical protein
LVAFSFFIAAFLFHPEEAEDERRQDEKDEDQVVDAFFLPDEIPTQDHDEIGGDEIIKDHDDVHVHSHMLQRTRNESLALKTTIRTPTIVMTSQGSQVCRRNDP